MSKEIPFFSARKINAVDDYERFHHTRAYLKSLSPLPDTSFKLSDEHKIVLEKIRKACGYSHRSKFIIHKREWDRLERPVPLKYFNYLGVDYEVLDLVLDLDRREFEQALELPRYPKFAIIRLMAAIYANCEIPGGMEEREAVEYVAEVVKEKRFRCCINYPQLKTIYFDPRTGVSTIYYPPEITFTKLYAEPRRDGRMIGRSSIA